MTYITEIYGILYYSSFAMRKYDFEKINCRFTIISLDREKATLFTINNGSVEQKELIKDGHVPQRIAGGPGAADRIDRHTTEHLHKHFKLISKKATEFIDKNKDSFILIGGHKTLSKQLGKYLPRKLRKLIAGYFVTELNAGDNEIIENARKELLKINSNFVSY